METTRLNIAYLLPPVFKAKILGVAKTMQGFDHDVLVDDSNFVPHITIFIGEFPNKNIDQVVAKIEQLAPMLERPTFVHNGFSGTEGFVQIKYHANDVLMANHKKVIAEVNDLREGALYIKYVDKVESDENIKKYGMPNAMDKYVAHLSVAKLVDNDEGQRQQVRIAQEQQDCNFVGEAIGVCESAKYGVCKKVIRSFTIG